MKSEEDVYVEKFKKSIDRVEQVVKECMESKYIDKIYKDELNQYLTNIDKQREIFKKVLYYKDTGNLVEFEYEVNKLRQALRFIPEAFASLYPRLQVCYNKNMQIEKERIRREKGLTGFILRLMDKIDNFLKEYFK